MVIIILFNAIFSLKYIAMHFICIYEKLHMLSYNNSRVIATKMTEK
jgi:hypothetical protein